MEYQYYYQDSVKDNYSIISEPVCVTGTGYYYRLGDMRTTACQKYWRLQVMDQAPEKSDDPELLKPRQFVVRKANTPYLFTEGVGLITGHYWVHFTGIRIPEIIERCQLVPNKVYTLQESHMRLIRQDFDALFREFILRQSGYEEMTAALFTGILIRLGRFVQEDAPEAHETRLRSQLAQTAIHIHNHYTENISVAQLAEMEHLSTRQYRDVFRAAFGTSPNNYITNLRIANARKLLQETNLPVAQISRACGYEDSYYFSRLFSKKAGCSPLTYRKRSTQD